jgi:SAM-dependent methyltransferase
MDGYVVADVYSEHAESYTSKFFQSWRENSEVYTMLKTYLGHDNFNSTCLAGKRILDLACGGGNLVRILLQLGAERAVGVDISSGIIETATNLTKDAGFSSDRFAFYVADCSKVDEVLDSIKDETVKEFDIVTGCWLLCNAPTLADLGSMAEVGNRLLKPVGIFMNILVNPESYFNDPELFNPARSYGLLFERCGEKDSIPFRKVTFFDTKGEKMFDVYNYCYSYEQLRCTLSEHGFVSTEVVSLKLAPYCAEQADDEFKEYIQNDKKCHMTCLVSRKIDILK